MPGPLYGTLRPENIRYVAPEHCLSEYYALDLNGVTSKESDVYSLAMTAFEVCSLL